MSDSINEQRCNHGKTGKHRVDLIPRLGMWTLCPGPSVVTPPTQDEHRSRAINEARVGDRVEAVLKGTLVAYDSDLGKWTLETDGTDHVRWQIELHWAQPFTVPAAPSVSTDHTDERRACPECGSVATQHRLRCKSRPAMWDRPAGLADYTDIDKLRELETAISEAGRAWWNLPAHPAGCETYSHALAAGALTVVAPLLAELVGLRTKVDQLRGERRRCNAIGHPTVTPESLIPCQLDRDHDGDHYSTSGCSGGAVSWPRAEAERDAALAEVDQLHTDNHELVHRLFKAENSVSPLQAERDALQARIDAATGSLPMLREQIDSYVTDEARGLLLYNLDILAAALGVDPQKDRKPE